MDQSVAMLAARYDTRAESKGSILHRQQNTQVHPEGTSNGSDICDFSKVSDFNENEMWKIPLKII